MGAKRSLGQHFLVSAKTIQAILDACREASKHADGVLEIGPGQGALTAGLDALGKPLVLAEKDDRFAADLAIRFPKARVLHGDAREVDLVAIGAEAGVSRWLIVGNLPYNVGTEIARKTLALPSRISAVVWMLQKEVVQKMVAGPREEGYGPLAAWTQSAWRGEKLFDVLPGAFRPPPRVTSAVVLLRPRDAPLLAEAELAAFDRFVRDAFSRPRRKMAANLDIAGCLPKEEIHQFLLGRGLPADARPEAVPVTCLAELFRRSKAPTLPGA